MDIYIIKPVVLALSNPGKLSDLMRSTWNLGSSDVNLGSNELTEICNYK